LERETGFEPATSSLGIQTYVGSKSLARFCCEFLNLQRLAESAFSGFDRLNEAQTRHVLHTKGPNFHLDDARTIKTGKPFWPTRSLVPNLDTFSNFRGINWPAARTDESLAYQTISTWTRHFTLAEPTLDTSRTLLVSSRDTSRATSKSGRHKRTQGESNGKRH
jgi:hypothetical protein